MGSRLMNLDPTTINLPNLHTPSSIIHKFLRLFSYNVEKVRFLWSLDVKAESPFLTWTWDESCSSLVDRDMVFTFVSNRKLLDDHLPHWYRYQLWSKSWSGHYESFFYGVRETISQGSRMFVLKDIDAFFLPDLGYLK